jgi:probable phosphoglycerate mutase
LVDHDGGMGRSVPLVWMVRHGETEWSRTGRHTSYTEVDLTPTGEAEARSLEPVVTEADLDLVLCSPRLRALRTAEIAGLAPFVVCQDLGEWDYGDLEGLTTAEIQERLPGWSIWMGPWPGGETPDEVAARADRVIETVLDSGAARVGLVGHGHFSRVVAARWVGGDVSVGRWLDLDTGTVSQLGWYRSGPVICCWNARAASRV